MPAPKKNKFALGNEGKPKTFAKPQDLQDAVDDYFNWADLTPITVLAGLSQGEPVYVQQQRPYTVEGLAEYLGCDRRTLLNYQKQEGREEYFHIITRAKEKINRQRIEYATIGVYKEGFTKFLLKNNSDYVEEIEHKVEQPAGPTALLPPVINIYSSGPPLSDTEEETDNDKRTGV